MSEKIILELKNIDKSFPGVRVLKRVNFTLRKGTVHAIVGENGAGKSTLMKILSGMYQPDSGEIWLEKSRCI
ncbi:MAG: ATP-binding cassette domain-containing protein [Dysosmobacter sp.]|nr:ATP-binding cassette domain-containing protein [Dysosmobacter sp.]